jgi:hypothetical protein
MINGEGFDDAGVVEDGAVIEGGADGIGVITGAGIGGVLTMLEVKIEWLM